jgi:hypothetical protein
VLSPGSEGGISLWFAVKRVMDNEWRRSMPYWLEPAAVGQVEANGRD